MGNVMDGQYEYFYLIIDFDFSDLIFDLPRQNENETGISNLLHSHLLHT